MQAPISFNCTVAFRGVSPKSQTRKFIGLNMQVSRLDKQDGTNTKTSLLT